MVEPPVLALPDFTKPFLIETDPSGLGMGVVLMQNGHPIAFISKAFSKKNVMLSTYERELLAVVFAVQKWQHYLYKLLEQINRASSTYWIRIWPNYFSKSGYLS